MDSIKKAVGAGDDSSPDSQFKSGKLISLLTTMSAELD